MNNLLFILGGMLNNFTSNPFVQMLSPYINLFGQTIFYGVIGFAIGAIIYSGLDEQRKVNGILLWFLLYAGGCATILGTNLNLFFGIIIIVILTALFYGVFVSRSTDE